MARKLSLLDELKQRQQQMASSKSGVITGSDSANTAPLKSSVSAPLPSSNATNKLPSNDARKAVLSKFLAGKRSRKPSRKSNLGGIAGSTDHLNSGGARTSFDHPTTRNTVSIDQGRESSSSFFSRSSQDKEIKHPLHTIKSGDEDELKRDQLPSAIHPHIRQDDSISVYTESTCYSTTASLHSINGRKKKKKKKKRKARIVQQGNHITCIRPRGERKSSMSRSIEVSPFNESIDVSCGGRNVSRTPSLSQRNLDQHNQISLVFGMSSDVLIFAVIQCNDRLCDSAG